MVNKRNTSKIKKRFIIIFFMIIILLFVLIRHNIKPIKKVTKELISALDINNYDVIKQDTNVNYKGIGQEKVYNKDGYFTTFTTIDENKKVYKEYKQNGNASWSNNEYWDGIMADNGCGITALSIILSGYGKIYTPEYLRQKYYPEMNYNEIKQELFYSFGIEASDFYYDKDSLSEEKIKNHLESNRPILICVWTNSGKNRWTTASHYMVLLATDGDNMVYISNPNGGENDYRSSGWYEFDEIIPYIASAIYIESE